MSYWFICYLYSLLKSTSSIIIINAWSLCRIFLDQSDQYRNIIRSEMPLHDLISLSRGLFSSCTVSLPRPYRPLCILLYRPDCITDLLVYLGSSNFGVGSCIISRPVSSARPLSSAQPVSSSRVTLLGHHRYGMSHCVHVQYVAYSMCVVCTYMCDICPIGEGY